MNNLFINHPEVIEYQKTYLSQDANASDTTLNVDSGISFSANTYILVGEIGHENSEIKLISGAGNTTLTSAALTFAHSKGTVIYFIPYNQIELYRSTDTGATYSLASTYDIQVDQLKTPIQRASDNSTDYYKIRFKNANDTTYSNYSDAVVATGFADNSVWAIKNRALTQLGEKIEGIITDDFLNTSLWEGRREFDNERKRWSFRTSFNSDIGNISTGSYSVSVPTLLRNPDSSQNILGLRIGNQGNNLSYIPKRKWDEWYRASRHTTVATQPTVGATTITLTNTRDFDASGSIKIYEDTITYTANNTSTGVLSGIPASGSGSITATHAIATDVWQNIGFALPSEYTIFEDKIYFNTPFEATYDGMNIWMDYYRILPAYNSDGDTLDEPEYDMFVSFLKWKIKSLKSRGELKAETDSDYLEWTRRKAEAKRKETLGQAVQFVPDIDDLQLDNE